MKLTLFPMLGYDGIRKNARLYLPFIFSSSFMAMMYYIVCCLRESEVIANCPGGSFAIEVLTLGQIVILIFSQIFLFYIASFLIKRRSSEFGLYSVLGMTRANLIHILFYETLYLCLATIFLGGSFGILFSKLAELAYSKMLGAAIDYRLTISLNGLTAMAGAYGLMFVVIYLSEFYKILKDSTISLLKSESHGEKAIKANTFLAMTGFVLLVIAYGIAVKVKNPIESILFFFFAVILVIIATYCLMIAGSVFICQLLKCNRRYYYQPANFVATSTLAYRMRRNGAGLASICILSTMVLVTLSSTASLYFGTDQMIDEMYPKALTYTVHYASTEELSLAHLELFKSSVEECVGDAMLNPAVYRAASASGILENGSFIATMDYNFDNYIGIDFLLSEDYASLTGEKLQLAPEEVVIFSDISFGDSVTIGDDRYVVKESREDNGLLPNIDGALMSTAIIVGEHFPKEMDQAYISYGFDNTDFDLDKLFAIRVNGSIGGYLANREAKKIDSITTFSGFFYLGIVLSLVFALATVLIIYYKQLQEGYEDMKQYAIMRKVGMSDIEVRKCVNKQLLTVFFAPLLLTGLHLIFAFPMINLILRCFHLLDTRSFGIITACCFITFAVLYVLVYKLTEKTYISLVS